MRTRNQEEHGENLRNSLRLATRNAHSRLDHHPLLEPLLGPHLTLQHYSLVLQSLNYFYKALMPSIEVELNKVDDLYQFTDRLPWLREDLQFLTTTDFRVIRTDLRWQVPPATSIAELIGYLYVVEGSTLGAQIIAQRVFVSLGLTKNSGARFFNGAGSATGENWHRFLEFSDANCSQEDKALAIRAAQTLFENLSIGLDNVWQKNRSDVHT